GPRWLGSLPFEAAVHEASTTVLGVQRTFWCYFRERSTHQLIPRSQAARERLQAQGHDCLWKALDTIGTRRFGRWRSEGQRCLLGAQGDAERDDERNGDQAEPEKPITLRRVWCM